MKRTSSWCIHKGNLMKGEINRETEKGGEKRERERWHSAWKASVDFSWEKRFQSGGFGCWCGRLDPDMKNEKVRFLAQGKRFAGTEPEEAFCASPLPQVTNRGGGWETLSGGRKRIPRTGDGSEGRGGEGDWKWDKNAGKRLEIQRMNKTLPVSRESQCLTPVLKASTPRDYRLPWIFYFEHELGCEWITPHADESFF